MKCFKCNSEASLLTDNNQTIQFALCKSCAFAYYKEGKKIAEIETQPFYDELSKNSTYKEENK